MNIVQQILQDLQNRKKVELSGLGVLYIIIKPAEVDERNDRICPPKEEIAFSEDKRVVKNNYTVYAQELLRELLIKEQIEVEGLGKFINNSGKIFFFSQERILNNSFYGLEEVTLAKLSKIELYQDIKKKSNNSYSYKINKSLIWICLGIIFFGFIFSLGVVFWKKEIFGNKFFRKNHIEEFISIKKDWLKKRKFETTKMKLDSTIKDSIN